MATDQLAIWADDTTSVTNIRIKTEIPEIRPVELKFQLAKGGHETLLFLALQIERTRDKSVALRALASALAILFKQDKDYTGGGGRLVTLDGLDEGRTLDTSVDDSTPVGRNFEDGAPLTVGDLRPYLGDIDEIGAYFGVLFMAGVKRRTDLNRDAFNENRKSSVRSLVNQDLAIFVPNSVLLSDAVLDTVYAAFNSFLPNRMYMVQQAVLLSAQPTVGAALAFTTLFLMLEDAGLGSLRIIKEAVLKYPWIRTSFPECKPEFHAANIGQQAVRAADLSIRPYCKAVYGNRFVPVAQNEIANLMGICKRVLSYTMPNYRNFGGGRISDKQEALIQRKMEELGIQMTPDESTSAPPTTT